jgi:hypothetical protein
VGVGTRLGVNELKFKNTDVLHSVGSRLFLIQLFSFA